MTKHTPYQPGQIIKSGNTNDDIDGLSTGENDVPSNSLALFRAEMFLDAFVPNSMKWTKISGLNATMTIGAYYLRGNRYEAAGISSKTFPDNSDTYVFFDESGTAQYDSDPNGSSNYTKAVDNITSALVITKNGQITDIYQSGVDGNGEYVYNTSAIGKPNIAFDVGMPVGAYLHWSGESASIPTGFLWANGAAVSRTRYAAYFKIVGTKYGAGDGSTTFNLPDTRGRTIHGYTPNNTEFNTVGRVGGEIKHQMTQNELVNHGHGVYDPGHSHGTAGHFWQDAGGGGTYNMTAGGNRYARGLVNVQVHGAGSNIGIYGTGGSAPFYVLSPYITGLILVRVF